MKPTIKTSSASGETTQDAHIKPEWLRLPKPPARCPITSLSRSKIWSLISPNESNGFKPPVQSKVLKGAKTASRGIRLVSASSLRNYIMSQGSDE